MSTIDKLDSFKDTDQPFGPYQEEAIVSLALDHPEFFTSVGRFMKPEMFKRLECQYVMAKILNSFNEHNVIPTRALLKDEVEKSLSVDDPFEPILAVIDRKSDNREVPLLKNTLLKWAKDRAYGLIYSDEAMDAYHNQDYAKLEAIINEANRIADIGDGGFWFFENLDILFNKDTIEHKTTGFPQLDSFLNNGGPSPKEVVCWLAATNVGKCHTLQSKIFEEKLSKIYEIEFEDGTIKKIAGFRKVQTKRGTLRVCDLTDGDDIEQIFVEDIGDIIV
jgi:hypothetical protein